MTTYRHAKHSIAVEGCAVIQHPSSWMCGCTTPTPDPTSPCGYFLTPDVPCGAVARIHGDALGEVFGHPHVATRCANCGHAIEVTP